MGVPVDWHVHVHDPAHVPAVLDAAAGCFARAGSGGPLLGVLMLAEMPGQSVFEALRARPGLGGSWRVRPTEEAESLLACRGEERMAIVAGFQVVSGERLEVLALGTTTRPADGLPADRMLAALRDQGAMAVLPWGVGKWFGARGALVGRLVEATPAGGMWLGDNGGRPGFWPTPGAFGAAARRGLAVLPGTDALPGSRPHAGGFGGLVPGPLDADRPAAALRRTLAEAGCEVRPYGARVGTAGFVRGQAGLRLRKGG